MELITFISISLIIVILLLLLVVMVTVSLNWNTKNIQDTILEAQKTDTLNLVFLKALLTAKPDTEYVTACHYEHKGKPVNYKSYGWKFCRFGKYLSITVRYYEDKDTNEPIELISYEIYTSSWYFPF